MQWRFWSVVSGLLVLGAVFWALWYLDFPLGSERTFEGFVISASPGGKILTVRDPDQREVTVATLKAQLFDKNGNEVDASYVQSGFRIRTTAYFDNLVAIASHVEVIDEPNIIIFSPYPDTLVKRPFGLSGIARVFENTVNYRLKDSESAVLREHFATATADTGEYGTFEADITYARPRTERGVLEIFSYSAEDGSEVNKIIIPVRFSVLE